MTSRRVRYKCNCVMLIDGVVQRRSSVLAAMRNGFPAYVIGTVPSAKLCVFSSCHRQVSAGRAVVGSFIPLCSPRTL